jgi:ubiquinol-cytochrome c reductase iron-sulfur subunit
VAEAAANNAHGDGDATRRDFIYIAGASVATVGVAATVWPFIDQMNPAADTRALSTTEVDLAAVPEGQQIRVLWQGKPVFVRHRTASEISAAQRDDFANLKDPQSDADRLVQEDGQPGRPEWLILQASCTHLGCIPTFAEGAYHGWFCPCHGSVYDTSGRIRSGPAPKNLLVAPYVFTNPTTIRIG